MAFNLLVIINTIVGAHLMVPTVFATCLRGLVVVNKNVSYQHKTYALWLYTIDSHILEVHSGPTSCQTD